MKWVRDDILGVYDEPSSERKMLRHIILPMVSDIQQHGRLVRVFEPSVKAPAQYIMLEYQTEQDAAEAAAEIRQAVREWRENNV